ncbi:MAG: ABC transporter permease [Candidatus Korobacteraceae bacterium]|jgi:putative ABC transport system permease protein
MISSETWGVAVDALRANKVKAALTMLGVMIGSACIVLVVTIALIGKNYVIAQIEGVGSNIVYANYLGGGTRTVADELSIGDMNAARELPHVVEVAGTHDSTSSNVVVNGKEKPVVLIGVTQGFQKIRNLLILKGRFFDDVDMQTAAKACLITQDLAKQYHQDMIGKDIRVGELRLTVIAVFRERVATFGQSEIASESVLIPFQLMKTYRGEDYVRTLYTQADSSENVPLVTDEVQHLLQARHRTGVVYTVQNLSSILEAAHKISIALTAVLLMVGFVALVVSGVGIMNIMLVTVTERTREIGVRKAVGAKRSEILYQFLIEAFLISGIGAVVGILIAVGVKIVVEPLLPAEYNMRIPISLASIVVSFVVSCGTGVLFGYLPANRASKLQPTESLHE